MSNFLRTGKKIVAIGRCGRQLAARRADPSLFSELADLASAASCSNYKAHALELKNAVPKEPFFFLKPTTSYVQDGGLVEIPKGVEVHHES